MKVGFIAPLGIAAVNGGIRTQALQTAIHLRKLGVEIEFITPWQEHLDVDLVHVFSAGPDTLGIIKRVAELGISIVLSPVFYSNRSTSTIAFSLKAEQFFSIFGSGIRSDFGIKAESCKIADHILPNTTAEATLVEKGLGIKLSKISVIPNGVEARFAKASPNLFSETYGVKDFVLFVGQAGAPRKNVLALIEAAQKIESQIVIIGSFYDNEYGNKCKQLAQKAGNVMCIETLEHSSELLSSAYAACYTFVLPSFYETPGIAAMEAALTGANICITEKGGTKDYFGNYVEYLSPTSMNSIAKSINNSLQKKKKSNLKTHIKKHFTWEIVAKKTLAIYKDLNLN